MEERWTSLWVLQQSQSQSLNDTSLWFAAESGAGVGVMVLVGGDGLNGQGWWYKQEMAFVILTVQLEKSVRERERKSLSIFSAWKRERECSWYSGRVGVKIERVKCGERESILGWFFCWLGHCKMSLFYYPSSQGGSIKHDLCDGLTILSKIVGVRRDHLLCAS